MNTIPETIAKELVPCWTVRLAFISMPGIMSPPERRRHVHIPPGTWPTPGPEYLASVRFIDSGTESMRRFAVPA